MLAHYCLDERQGSHGLKTLARRYFQAPEYDAALKGGKGRLDELPTNQLYQYLAYDVYYTHKLAWVLAGELNEQGLRHIHDDILLPASHALGEIENHGILIDQHHLKVLGEQFEKDIAAATIELQLETENPKFNPNSPKQVAEYLYGKLKLRPAGTKTGKVELNELNHPFAKKILELRQK
jgi:DNA polymerase-1